MVLAKDGSFAFVVNDLYILFQTDTGYSQIFRGYPSVISVSIPVFCPDVSVSLLAYIGYVNTSATLPQTSMNETA